MSAGEVTSWKCAHCASEGRRGYCAPLRCYCAHDTCHAADSFYEPTAPDLSTIREAPASKAWANRKESTWIDQM